MVTAKNNIQQLSKLIENNPGKIVVGLLLILVLGIAYFLLALDGFQGSEPS